MYNVPVSRQCRAMKYKYLYVPLKNLGKGLPVLMVLKKDIFVCVLCNFLFCSLMAWQKVVIISIIK